MCVAISAAHVLPHQPHKQWHRVRRAASQLPRLQLLQDVLDPLLEDERFGRVRFRPALVKRHRPDKVQSVMVSSRIVPLSQIPAHRASNFGPPSSRATAVKSWFVSWLGPAAQSASLAAKGRGASSSLPRSPCAGRLPHRSVS